MKNAVILSGMVAAMLALMLCGCGGGQRLNDNEKLYICGNAEIDEQIKSIDIDWPAGLVEIDYHSGDTLKIEESAAKQLPDDMLMQWYVDGTTLKIKEVNKKGFRLHYPEKKLTLTLPENFSGEKISISLASAELNTELLRAASINVSTASGKVCISAQASETLKISSASGRIELTQQGECKSVKLSSASGSIQAELEKAQSVSADSSSGEISLYGDGMGEVNVHSASGRVEVETADKLEKCKIKTASGDVRLVLPEELGFTASIDTASGSFESDVPVKKNGKEYVAGAGGASISITTASGDITLG